MINDTHDIILWRNNVHVHYNDTRYNALVNSYLVYFIYCLNSYLSDIGFGSVTFSYLIMLLVPFCINGARITNQIIYLFLILAAYPFIKQTIPIFFIYFFVFAFRNISIQRIAKITLIFYIIFFISQLFLLKMGIVSNDVHSLLKGETNTFGFGNSNTYASFLFGINICIYLVSCNKSFWIGLISIAIINQYMLIFTSGRTPWIATLVLILFALCNKFKILSNWTKYPLSILPLVLTILCYYFVKNAQSFPIIDLIFSGRLELLKGTIDSWSLKNWLFGYIQEDALDCAYVGIVANGGILWLIFFLFSITFCIVKRYNHIKIYLPVVIAMLISGLCENSFCGFRPYNILFWMILLHRTPYQKLNKSI